MNKKVASITIIFLIVIALSTALSMKERACFWLEKNGSAGICYEKPLFLNDEKSAEKLYSELVSVIKNNDVALNEYVFFSEKLKQSYGDSAYGKVRENYSWISSDSLVYVVEGEDFSVLLLEKAANDNYALYLSKNENKFYFSFRGIDRYEPIVAGWVNNLYEKGIHINSVAFWDRAAKSECQFRKGNVYLISKKPAAKENGKNVCAFGRYLLIGSNDDRYVKRIQLDRTNENENILDITMRFIEWVSS